MDVPDTNLSIRCRDFHSNNKNEYENPEIRENVDFRYIVFHPAGIKKNREMILLLHGLNERSWQKYLPWAEKLCLETKKSVLLFPIAYHMNRSSGDWMIRKSQFSFQKKREADYPGLMETSSVNAVLSERLQKSPERFYTSGLQTYHDILDLIRDIKKGSHPDFQPDTTMDIFAYSVGGYLAEVLLMADPENWFSRTKLMIFCSGSALIKTNPLSRAILDSKAVKSLVHFFKRNSKRKTDIKVPGKSKELHYFKCLLYDRKFRKERTGRLSEIGPRIRAIALSGDKVVPAEDIRKALPKVTAVEDFTYPYKHEMPFPVLKNGREEVDAAFNRIFSSAAEHLN
jgi:pimeloyl-ACP methyl ester carboxylesterase